MKESMKKVSSFLRKVFGYGITFCLLAGGLTFVGYLIALVLGGTAAEQICRFIYKSYKNVQVNFYLLDLQKNCKILK